MSKLITGGTGYIGVELAHILVEQGFKPVLFDVAPKPDRIKDINEKVELVQGDLGNWCEVMNVIKNHNITEIYHLGSMLTYMSELNPWASFRANVIGTYNVLEAARLTGVQKGMFSSTLGTFGLLMGEVVTDTSIQRPITMYGCGKLYCEGLGRFYRNKFGLDFRAVRYAHMMAPDIRTPGHWAPRMVQDAILGKPHKCVYGTPDSVASMIYVKDAARAAYMVLQAPKENIKMVNYNVAGVSAAVSARELETILKSRFPKTQVTYKPETTLSSAVFRRHKAMKIFDDSYAREEWNWKPQYDTPEAIIEIFQKDLGKFLGNGVVQPNSKPPL